MQIFSCRFRLNVSRCKYVEIKNKNMSSKLHKGCIIQRCILECDVCDCDVCDNSQETSNVIIENKIFGLKCVWNPQHILAAKYK